jgi:hypothetical protein
MVSAQVLNQGQLAYQQYCRACHGDSGDGRGPAAEGLRPAPRDFTTGQFKFGWVLDGKLPRDEDLVRLVRSNLHGTSMVGWDVPDAQLLPIVQYLKTFSDAWKEADAVGEPVVPPPDPWVGKELAAVERGALVYHGYAQCQACHPAYLSQPEVTAASLKLTGKANAEARPLPSLPELKESDYSVRGQRLKQLSPDFLVNEVRSPRDATQLADLYRVLVSGVGGAAMPGWDANVLPEKASDLWALAYYVRSLVRLRGTTAGLALRARLDGTPQPAAPPPAPR